MEELIFKTLQTEFKADDKGQVSAVIATFGVIDLDGDIIDPGAFTDSQSVAMVWSHDWRNPVGKGAIQVTNTAAIFNGEFFMDTKAGLEAFKTVKAMGDLQEWSWGFRVKDASWEMIDDTYIRRIRKAEVYEVSPVLKGAGIGTFTLDLKFGQTFEDHVKAVLDAARSVGERLRSVIGLREKDGRSISARRREDLQGLSGELRKVADNIDEQLKATEQPANDPRQLYNQFLNIEARLNGVSLEE